MTTLLFSIPLMGNGTAEVESLPSFLHRCAVAHGNDVGPFMQTVDRLLPNSHLCIADTFRAKHTKPHDLVRPGKLSECIVVALSQATGHQLDSSVLWVLGNMLSRSANEVVKGFRWCPECLAESQSLGLDSYFKLIWHMSAVKACHIHRTPLVQKCQFCGCDQTSYRKKNDIGFCQNCDESLAKRKIKISDSALASSWEDIGNDVVQLFRDLSKVDPRGLSEDGPYKSINDLMDYYWKVEREDIFYAALNRDELISLAYRHKKVSLLTARRIAFKLGIPLYAFLAGEASQISGVLDYGVLCSLPDGYLDVRHKAPKNHAAIIRKIRRIIKEQKAPLPVSRICEEAGVSTGYLAYRYPVLYKEVVQRRKEFEQEQHLKTIYKAQAFALDYFFNERYSEAPKSRKQAYRKLREETGLPKWILKKAIQNAYRALNG
ncbi:TniQ family protein [Bermanella sp. R86510]|uniref:TniQ family protein n=1 Tax=unclassified Bermanella TaxID=2627862 RepID=UPI0037C87AF6